MSATEVGLLPGTDGGGTYHPRFTVPCALTENGGADRSGSIAGSLKETLRNFDKRGCPLTQPTRQDFENLLAFRVALRRFQRWSEDRAGAVGLTHVQHQLLVAIKGHPGGQPPSVGQLADYLLLQSHSAVGLVDRAEAAGFVRRRADLDDARVVRVELTPEGDRLVTELTRATLTEMRKLAIALNNVLLLHEEQVS